MASQLKIKIYMNNNLKSGEVVIPTTIGDSVSNVYMNKQEILKILKFISEEIRGIPWESDAANT